MIKQYELKQALNTSGKVYLGIPRERLYIPEFVDNRDQILMTLQKAGRTSGYFQADGHRVDKNRDHIVTQFLSLPEKPEWLQMLDSDMDHPQDAPIRLTKYGKPIIGGLYFHRGKSHDPFVFEEVEDGLDDYGRMTHLWRPMRDKVYTFLSENNIPYFDGALTIDECKNSPLVECDAIATGVMCIHRSVLELMNKPIFEYRALAISEDMQFCYEAKHDYGIPIFCDMSTMSGHYIWSPQGQAQFRLMYEKRGINFSGFAKSDSIEWLAEYLKIPKDAAQEKIEKGNAHMVSDYWVAKFGEKVPTREEVTAFYKDAYTGQLYLIELLHWNFSQVFYNIKSLFIGLRHKNVLEIGSGIGSLAIQLSVQNNQVTAAEVNQTLRDFAQMRYAKVKKALTTEAGDVKFVVDKWKEAPDNTFDATVSTDTFEHITAEELPQMLKDICRVTKMGGDLIYHANFGQQDLYPMHYDHTAMWDTWLIEAGFMPLSPTHAIKVR